MAADYFSELNYSLANEDTSLELAILPAGLGHVVAVAGSGGRALPLMAQAPKRLTCVDLSPAQLHVTELRFSAARAFSHSEYLGFWGYPPDACEPAERRQFFERLELSAPARQYLATAFEKLGWRSLLYQGRWERTFAALSRVNRLLTGTAGLGLFGALTRDEHDRYLRERFPRRGWSLVLRLMANAGVFNALLYKGSFPKKNLPQSFFRFYTDVFDRLFAQGPARRSFFLQICFFGKVVFPEGCPIECDPGVYRRAQAALAHARVDYVLGDVLEVLKGMKGEVDFLSISDVPSYFGGERERDWLQQARPALKPGSLTVLRNYLHLPVGLDSKGFEKVTGRYREAIAREKVGVYDVEVFRTV